MELRGFRYDSEVAKAANIAPSAISDWRNGKTSPRSNSLYAVAEVLKIDRNWLISGNGDDPVVLDSEPNQEVREKAAEYKALGLSEIKTDTLKALMKSAVDGEDWAAVQLFADELRRREGAE